MHRVGILDQFDDPGHARGGQQQRQQTFALAQCELGNAIEESLELPGLHGGSAQRFRSTV